MNKTLIAILSGLALSGCAATPGLLSRSEMEQLKHDQKNDIVWEDTGKSVFDDRENYSVNESKYCITMVNGKQMLGKCGK